MAGFPEGLRPVGPRSAIRICDANSASPPSPRPFSRIRSSDQDGQESNGEVTGFAPRLRPAFGTRADGRERGEDVRGYWGLEGELGAESLGRGTDPFHAVTWDRMRRGAR